MPSEYQVLTNQNYHPFVLKEEEVNGMECSLQCPTFSGEYD